MLLAHFPERKEEPPSRPPNQDFMTGFVVQVSIWHGRHRESLHVTQGCCYSTINSACYSSVKCASNESSCILLRVRLGLQSACISSHFLTLYVCVLCVGTQQGRRGSRPLRQPTTEEPWWAQDACRTSRLDNRADITAPLCWLCTFHWLLKSSLFVSPFALCQGIILVYDITDEKSFENIQNWMKSIKEVRLFPLSQNNQERLRK